MSACTVLRSSNVGAHNDFGSVRPAIFAAIDNVYKGFDAVVTILSALGLSICVDGLVGGGVELARGRTVSSMSRDVGECRSVSSILVCNGSIAEE